MNLSIIAAFVASTVVFAISIYLSLGGFGGFYDRNSAIIVVGGSICAIMICVPLLDLKNMIKDSMQKVFKKSSLNYAKLIEEIVGLAQARRKGDAAFEQQRNAVTDPFLKDASALLFWAEAEISEDEFMSLLETKSSSYTGRISDSSKVYKTMAKFPPAFGMIGTVLGLIALLQSLGNPDAKSQIGPAMAIALVTTLYGISINNLFIIPMAEALAKASESEEKGHNLSIEGLLLILQKKPTRYIEEKLKSYLTSDQLPPSQGGSAGLKAA